MAGLSVADSSSDAAPLYLQGSCNCGQIQVTVHTLSDFLAREGGLLCHCPNCQRSSGSTGIGYVLIPEEDVTLKGAPKTYHDTKTLSKRTVIRQFCGDCGSPVRTYGPWQGHVYIPTGLFADSSPRPRVEIFVANKPSWAQTVDSTDISYKAPGPELRSRFKGTITPAPH